MNEVSNLLKSLNALHKKEELSSEKVELANQAGDLEKKAQALYFDAKNNSRKAVLNAADDIDKQGQKIFQLQQEAEQSVKKLEKWEKEIGEPIKAKQNYEKALSEINDYFSKLDKLQRDLRQAAK